MSGATLWDAATETLVQGEPVGAYPRYAPEARQGKARDIILFPDPILGQRSEEVTEFGTAALRQLINDMFRTMYLARGVGLAANQVGSPVRAFVYDCVDGLGRRHVGHVVNPEIGLSPSKRRMQRELMEGCLSLPGADTSLPRPEHVSVHGRDKERQPVTPNAVRH